MAGHLPGMLLARLRHDLHALHFQMLGESSARFHDSARDLEFTVEEQVEKHFLLRVVTARFIYRVPASAAGNRRLRLRHTGAWKRTGIDCTPPHAAFTADADLARALLPLDFTHCELVQDAAGWQCRLTHYGASEVIGRFPPLRRYLRLPAPQLAALLDVFAALRANRALCATPAAAPRHPPPASGR
ncbi:MAG: DUF3156 family protein [Steroidobacteraceae bacterium]